MEAQDYLRKYKKNLFKIANKRNEIALLETMREGTTAQMGGERVQTSGTSDKIATATARIVDLQAEIKDCEREMKEITDTIETLDSADEYNVLHKRYVQDLLFKEIGAACGMNKDWATTIHGRALQNVKKILDEREQ